MCDDVGKVGDLGCGADAGDTAASAVHPNEPRARSHEPYLRWVMQIAVIRSSALSRSSISASSGVDPPYAWACRHITIATS